MIPNQSLLSCWIASILMLSTNVLLAQSGEKHRRLQLHTGLSSLAAKDYSASPLRYTGSGLKVDIGYAWGSRPARDNVLSLTYRGGSLTHQFSSDRPMNINYVNLQFRHLRPVGEGALRLGVASSLFARYRNHIYIVNNSDSYDAGVNVGLAADFRPDILNDKWDLSLGLTLPVAAYYIRPVYGTPSPSDFLTEENYDVYNEGVTSALLSSGKVVSFDSYFELQSYLRVSRQVSFVIDEVQLRYDWNFARFQSLESSYHGEQFIALGLIKHLHKSSDHEK